MRDLAFVLKRKRSCLVSPEHFAGQRCDCTEHNMPKDRTISRLRGELHRFQEQLRKSEATKQPQKQPAKPTIFVITPTYARYGGWFPYLLSYSLAYFSITVLFLLHTQTHRCSDFFLSFLQAGAEGRVDSSVPDLPQRSSAPLDRRGRLTTQDAAGN